MNDREGLIAYPEAQEALRAAYGAANDLRSEADLLNRVWEQNPQLSAMRAGAAALATCIELLERIAE